MNHATDSVSFEEAVAEIVVPNVKAGLQIASPAIVRRKYSEYRRLRVRDQSYKEIKIFMATENRDRKSDDERSPELKGDLGARADELGTDPSEVGPQSAGQTASSLGLSADPDATEDSVEDLSDGDQAREAASVEGIEDAADPPERPTHTHEEYDRPDDAPPRRRDDEAA